LELLKKGAEANLYLHRWHGLQVIIKRRIRKNYRHKTLDSRIRSYRSVHEAQMIHESRKSGVPTPVVFDIDKQNFTIIMEYIEGKRVKELLETISSKRRKEICREIGTLIAKLHENDIIHGDLTTSNMIMPSNPIPKGVLYFIDFGLSYFSSEIEDKGVDLHLLKRALNSTHYRFSEECYSEVISSYKTKLGDDVSNEILNKVDEVERRGRYALRP
jgi:TP53 regulating kinase-like protein